MQLADHIKVSNSVRQAQRERPLERYKYSTFNTSSRVCLVYPECSGLYGSRGGASEGLHTDRAGRGSVLCAAEGSGHFL